MDIDSIIKRRRPAIRRQIADLTQQRIEQLQGELTDGAVAELVRDFLGDDSLDDGQRSRPRVSWKLPATS